MADKSKIAWTEATWNPVSGCSKVSEGCRFCYAERDWPVSYLTRKHDMLGEVSLFNL